MSFLLKSSPLQLNRSFVLNIILDGVGIGKNPKIDAFHHAHTPHFDRIKKEFLYREINAHGKYVGLSSNGDMGNSEVGHNAIGAGKIYSQGSKLVQESFEKETIYQTPIWTKLIENCLQNKKSLHLVALVSDGNVHSHINHLKKMILKASEQKVEKIFIHALLDGRDVPPTSSMEYIQDLEDLITTLPKTTDCKIASVGGRMVIVMDRYEADWEMVKKGWQLIVEGKGRQFENALQGIQKIREETQKDDQYLSPFIIAENGKAVGTVEEGDSVILCNFRGDRAIEFSLAMEDKTDDFFIKEKKINVLYAGMMEYDGDKKIPENYLVSPPMIEKTMGEYLVKNKVKLFAISETQKYGHVTFFWNGNRSDKFSEELEKYVEIQSDNVPFDERPWMKAAEITDKTIELLQTKNYQFGRINYPNGDMVGHSGDFHAARMSMEATDRCLGKLLKVVEELGGIAIVTADHGNCDEMYQTDKAGNIKMKEGIPISKTSHTLNQVPFIIFDPLYQGEYHWKEGDFGLANIAATTFALMGYEKPAHFLDSMVE